MSTRLRPPIGCERLRAHTHARTHAALDEVQQAQLPEKVRAAEAIDNGQQHASGDVILSVHIHSTQTFYNFPVVF